MTFSFILINEKTNSALKQLVDFFELLIPC